MKTILLLLQAIVLACVCSAQQKDTTSNKQTKELQAVTITAKTPLIKQEADRIVYDLQADVQSKLSSVLDMMRRIPYISVDANDNILLKGSNSYKIFINGRPSGLMASNPKEVLRSMPASTIKSIEVITNPPAKYDAEGMAGIINIVTLKQKYDGYKGTINASEKWPVGGPGSGGSLTARQSKLDLSAMAGINSYKIPETNKAVERRGTDASTLLQHATSKSNSYTAYAGMALSYEADSLNLLSGELNWNDSRAKGLAAQVSDLNTANNIQHYQLQNNNNNMDKGIDASFNYQKGFRKNKDQLLTISYQYSKYSSALYNNIAFTDKINYPTTDYRQYNASGITDQLVQADYMHSLKKLTIEGGLKSVFRINESDFEYRNFNPATGTYEINAMQSNDFNYKRKVLSLYNSYTYQNDKWQLKGGVRIEETITRMSYTRALAPNQQQYTNVLPSILINRKLKDNCSINFAYTRRIQRPTTTELNPFINLSDPNFQTSGNPYLRPISSDVYELSFLKSAKATINLSLGAMFFDHVFNAFPFYDATTNTSYTHYENYGSGRVLKTNIYINSPVGKRSNFTLNADIRHIQVVGADIKNEGFGVYIYASEGYNFDKGWRANADITYKMGGIILPIGNTSGYTSSSLSISKSFMESSLTISAATSNPFTRYLYTDETINSVNFRQSSRNQSYYRRFTLSINYRFGRLKEDMRKSKRTIAKEE